MLGRNAGVLPRFDFAQGQNDRRWGRLRENNNKSKSWLVEVLHPTHRGKAAMDGAPDRLWLGVGDNCNATAEADPCRMTIKETDKGKERTDNDKDEMRGFFASLRMTTFYLRKKSEARVCCVQWPATSDGKMRMSSTPR
jgi:hypothetical protein